MIYRNQFVVLLQFLTGAGLNILLGLLNEDVLFISVTVQNPEIQYGDAMHFLH